MEVWGPIFIAGILLIMFGLSGLLPRIQALRTKKEETKELRARPSERKYPEELLNRYSAKYPYNPEGALEFHISKEMKEGKTREQAIQELLKESD